MGQKQGIFICGWHMKLSLQYACTPPPSSLPPSLRLLDVDDGKRFVTEEQFNRRFRLLQLRDQGVSHSNITELNYFLCYYVLHQSWYTLVTHWTLLLCCQSRDVQCGGDVNYNDIIVMSSWHHTDEFPFHQHPGLKHKSVPLNAEHHRECVEGGAGLPTVQWLYDLSLETSKAQERKSRTGSSLMWVTIETFRDPHTLIVLAEF